MSWLEPTLRAVPLRLSESQRERNVDNETAQVIVAVTITCCQVAHEMRPFDAAPRVLGSPGWESGSAPLSRRTQCVAQPLRGASKHVT